MPAQLQRRLLIFAVLLTLVVGSLFAHWLLIGRFIESTDNAYVQGEITRVSSQLSARVAKVLVGDNQHVQKGDLLLELEADDFRLALDRARAALATRREKMMAGEESFLLPRDQGPVRRYARDIVDSRRNVLGLFMPAALFILFIVMAMPQLQYYTSPTMMLLMLVMGIDAILLARKVNKAVDAKFPDHTETRFKLGLYAVGRASQLRRMRAPRPQVARGTKVV